ncbi:histone deacetylase 6 isoform X2 [Halyomorpha halys]|uniref:histone deacetylase 6 isoform X2 n=1 Tax=Halyomorpha halys TaxID=286706 RepID=UPI0006D52098|nr:histone deacetylase 6 isoform X2 [Halyomorpha halys]
MGHKEMEEPPKKHLKKPSEGPLRRSSRINNQAKPNPGLVAAKKNAQLKMGNKKPVFSFVQDVYQVARDAKEATHIPTGLVYDNKMAQHKCLWDENYPECPKRLTSIIQRCEDLGLVKRCQLIESRQATEEELLTLHAPGSISLLKSTKNCVDESHLENISSRYDAIYIHPTTYDCSLLAAGSAIKLVDDICNKKIQNGMALIRPPGHHAMRSEFNGYCFFNNAALATRHALKLGYKRILIVDWDVHHGQGTQQMFYNDPRVVYFSIHRYEHGSFWPNLRESDFDFVGEGTGRGFNFNVPINSIGMGNADYLAVFHQVLLPVAYEFEPELIVVSAGYDSAIGDEKGEMELTPAVYAHLISYLMPLASGKVAVLLEGGYCIKSLSECAALTLRALIGDPVPSLGSLNPPSKSMVETISNVIYSHRDVWKCFRDYPTYSIYEAASEDEKRHLPRIVFNHNVVQSDKYPTRDCYPIQSSDLFSKLNSRLDSLINSTKLFSPKYKVCFVYDTKMMDHKNYEDRDHIEKPARISAIYKFHDEYGLLSRLHVLKSRSVTEDEIRYVHSKSHVNDMMNLSSLSSFQLNEKQQVYHSVYLHQDTYKAACLAAGSLLQVVDSVLQGESGTGVAVVRPPGHHADTDEPCGFCIFNNVAIAAHYAVKKYGLKRILILDWDVHHGNGTQEIFFEESSVLYISIHRFDNGSFFPNTGDGAATQVGRGNGEGYTVNIPWNKGNMGNGDYVAAFFQVVLPIAYQFDPELVLVSAGFDAAIGDPLGGCKVTPECFGHMTSWLLPLAGGKVILSLEGGYNIHSISYSMTMCTKALLGDPLPPLKEGSVPCTSASESIREVISAHSRYWSSLCFDAALPVENVLTERKQKKGNNIATNVQNQKNADTLAREVRDLSLGEEKLEETIDGNEEGNNKHSNNEGSSSSSSRTPNEPGMSSNSSGAASRPTLTEFLTENLEALQNEEMFAVVPLRTCPHLPEVAPVPNGVLDVSTPCSTCGDPSENWVCLTCYSVECGRYVNGHMMEHNGSTNHPLTLSFSDLSVWCYPCQNYIDNQVLYAAKNAAHISKFGTDLEWTYSDQPATVFHLDH